MNKLKWCKTVFILFLKRFFFIVLSLLLSYPNCRLLDFFFLLVILCGKLPFFQYNHWLNLCLSFPEGIHYWFIVLCTASVPSLKIYLYIWSFGFIFCLTYGWLISSGYFFYKYLYKDIEDGSLLPSPPAKFTPLLKKRLKCKPNGYGLFEHPSWASTDCR